MNVKLIERNSIEENDILTAMLPILSMLLKLMERKQQSKKPFSFDFSEKKDFILHCEEEFESQLSDKRIDKDKIVPLLKELSILSSTAKEEVKMFSLKQDYQYLSDQFLFAFEYFDKK